MVKKIVLFGSESTGKTTLAQQVAAHYHTVWVPEYSRLYQEQAGRPLTISDVMPIVRMQLQLEAVATRTASQLLICDTDILETKVYSEAYNGACPDELLQLIPQHIGDYYLLTHIDLPWEPDGIRDRPDNRQEMHLRFRHELLVRQLPFAEIWGNDEERLSRAVRTIDGWLTEG